MPTFQVRDMAVQKRESDLVLGTFGRGFWILDDYSPLREMTPETLAAEARLYPLRDAYSFNPMARRRRCRAARGYAPNPPVGAVFTYSVGRALPADTRLVLTITDDTGKQVRRIDVSKERACVASSGICAAIRRSRPRQTRPGAVAADKAAAAAEPVRAGRRRGWRRSGRRRCAGAAGGGRGGFGGQAAVAEPGRYTVTLGKIDGRPSDARSARRRRSACSRCRRNNY